MLNSRTFNNIKDLEEVFVNGSYKYYIRCGDDKKFADDMKNMIENGFSGSFVTAFYRETNFYQRSIKFAKKI